MFALSRSDVVPRTRQGLGTNKTMITLFISGRKLIVLDVLPERTKSNRPNFVHNIFPDLKQENRRYKCRKPRSTFLVDMDDSMCHSGSKVESKFWKPKLFRMPHPPYSPDLSPCDFWFFGILTGILKDHEFTSSGEIEEAITKKWNELTFDDVRSFHRNWVNHPASVIENGGPYVHE
jgi:histone-lysine N-methyltransferase SETMAR